MFEKSWGSVSWIAVKFQLSPDSSWFPEIALGLASRLREVEAEYLMLEGIALTEDYQTPNAVFLYLGVRLWVIRFIVERNSPDRQLIPKCTLSGKGLGCWLRSSDSFKRVRNSSLVE